MAIIVYFFTCDNLWLEEMYDLSLMLTYNWMMTVYGLFDTTDDNLWSMTICCL